MIFASLVLNFRIQSEIKILMLHLTYLWVNNKAKHPCRKLKDPFILYKGWDLWNHKRLG